MSFLRHGEIYRSDVGQARSGSVRRPLPALIGCDEFPVGYSLAGCSPAEPASASPTGNDSTQPPAHEQQPVHPVGNWNCLAQGFTDKKQPGGMKKLSPPRGAPQSVGIAWEESRKSFKPWDGFGGGRGGPWEETAVFHRAGGRQQRRQVQR